MVWQGMHEVLAPLVLTLERDCDLCRGSSSSTLASLMDPSQIEADAFVLFEKVMENLLPYYQNDEPPSGGRMGRMGSPHDQPKSPVLLACDRIQGEHLRRADPQVANALASLELAPQLYGMKWLRLLFGREFPLPEVRSRQPR